MPTGRVGLTGPGNLNCRYVIHAVGPVWDDSESSAYNVNLLATAIMNSLIKAEELGCKSISMPAISSGIFGFPKPLCAKVFYLVLKKFVQNALEKEMENEEDPRLALETVRLCNFDDETCEVFRAEFLN